MFRRLLKLAVSLSTACLIILLIILNIAAASSYNTQEVIDNMLSKLRESDRNLDVKVLDIDDINAYATIEGGKFQVRIFTGMINFTDNADQLAGVIGHEFAHHFLGHTSVFGLNVETALAELGIDPNKYTTSQQHELMADLVGAAIAQSAGYNPCEIAKLWDKMGVEFGNDPSPTHPIPLERSEQINRTFNCSVSE